MVDQGALAPIIELMAIKEAKTIMVVLDFINNVFNAADKFGPEAKSKLCLLFEEMNGLDRLEALQEHDNVEVCFHASNII